MEVNIHQSKDRKGKMSKEKEMNHQRQYKEVMLIPLSNKFFWIKNNLIIHELRLK